MTIVTSRRYSYRKMIFDQILKKNEEKNKEKNIIERMLYNFIENELPDEEPIPIKRNFMKKNNLIFDNKFTKLGITINIESNVDNIMKVPEIETKYLSW